MKCLHVHVKKLLFFYKLMSKYLSINLYFSNCHTIYLTLQHLYASVFKYFFLFASYLLCWGAICCKLLTCDPVCIIQLNKTYGTTFAHVIIMMTSEVFDWNVMFPQFVLRSVWLSACLHSRLNSGVREWGLKRACSTEMRQLNWNDRSLQRLRA